MGQWILQKSNRALRVLLVAIVACGIALSLTACTQVQAEDRLFQNISLNFLGEFVIPKNTSFKDTPVGGLSGITYSPKEDVFYAISDDRSEKAPARFYQLKLNLDKTGKPTGIRVTGVTTLKDDSGKPYEKGSIDPEGIAVTPQGTVWISSEGVASDNIPPSVSEYDLQGNWLRSLSIPDQYIPGTNKKGKRIGIQNNMGFESLTLNANAARMGKTEPYRIFTAAENALEQDKLPTPKEGEESPDGDQVRFMHYSLQDKRIDLVAEYLYPLEPRPALSGKFGLVEMASIDGAGRFLALERGFGLAGFTVKLFQVNFAGCKDTTMLESIQGLDTVVKSAQKEPVFNLNELEITIDNLEGMTLGPRLPDGSQSLIMISDDNFREQQKTQVLVFRIQGFKA